MFEIYAVFIFRKSVQLREVTSIKLTDMYDYVPYYVRLQREVTFTKIYQVMYIWVMSLGISVYSYLNIDTSGYPSNRQAGTD